jgi:hypothetical protein
MKGEKSINATNIKADVTKTNFSSNYIERALTNNLAHHFAMNDTSENNTYKKMNHNYKYLPSFNTNLPISVVLSVVYYTSK